MNDFLSFVSAYPQLSKKKADQILSEKVEDLCTELKHEIAEGLFAQIRESQRPQIKSNFEFQETVKEFLLGLIAEIKNFHEEIGAADSLAGIDANCISDKHDALSDDFFKKQFEPHELSGEEIRALKELAGSLIVSSITTDHTTGLVVAGYGMSSTFPAIESVEVEGVVCDVLKYSRVNKYSIEDAEDAGQVVSYAQTDVIERLLGGADPDFVRKSASFIKQSIVEAGAAIEAALRPARVSKGKIAERLRMLEDIGDIFQQKFEDETAPRLIKASTGAFDRMIALMPKQELVNLAEALVSITAVERKASSDLGTVGGAIDVALITKHEGFVWIKRKQHFDPNLNPRYFWRRYGKNIGGGGYGAGASWAERSGKGEAAPRSQGDGA